MKEHFQTTVFIHTLNTNLQQQVFCATKNEEEKKQKQTECTLFRHDLLKTHQNDTLQTWIFL